MSRKSVLEQLFQPISEIGWNDPIELVSKCVDGPPAILEDGVPFELIEAGC
jgi:hypothetical protein